LHIEERVVRMRMLAEGHAMSSRGMRTGNLSTRKKIAIWAIPALAILATALTIADVEITAINDLGSGNSRSDASGYFRITLPKGLRRRQPLTLRFGHKDYHSLEWDDFVGDKIYIARMVPLRQETNAEPHHPAVAVSNARVRYSVKATTEADVGSAVKTFEVANTGNQPCDNRSPCSSDGKW